jgi:hypothetical protein
MYVYGGPPDFNDLKFSSVQALQDQQIIFSAAASADLKVIIENVGSAVAVYDLVIAIRPPAHLPSSSASTTGDAIITGKYP